MPIRPEMRSRYPATWRTAIVPEIRARSGNRCECSGQCGELHVEPEKRCWAPHGAQIRRAVTRPELWSLASEPALDPGYAPPIRVVLTVAHLDHVPEHCDPSNLLHLCQRCHLLLDRYEHGRNAAETRRRRRAAGDLFAGRYPDILQR